MPTPSNKIKPHTKPITIITELYALNSALHLEMLNSSLMAKTTTHNGITFMLGIIISKSITSTAV